MTPSATWTVSKMRAPGKLLLGAATLWPVLYLLAFLAYGLRQVFSAPPSTAGLPTAFIGFHLATMFLSLVLLILYLVDVFRNGRVARDSKALWAAAIFFGTFLAMPVYWYRHIWRATEG